MQHLHRALLGIAMSVSLALSAVPAAQGVASVEAAQGVASVAPAQASTSGDPAGAAMGAEGTDVNAIAATAIKSVRVTSIPALLRALANNTVDQIVVANGTYRISTSSRGASNSLWIGSRFASRTRPVVVRAQTVGGVTFDAGGGALGGITFTGGAHNQTWIGFRFANGTVSQTGVIMFGGYAGQKAPYAITLKRITINHTVHRVSNAATDHAVYFSYALDTWRNILIDGLTVRASDAKGLASAIHMDHGYPADAPNVPAHGVTVRNLTFYGNSTWTNQQAIILWLPSVHDWLFDGARIVNAGGRAARFESRGAGDIVFRNIVSTRSHGFYSSLGSNPPGVTFSNNVWR